LARSGLHSAILLPLSGHDDFIFKVTSATESTEGYTDAHIELVNNIGHLLSHSFTRTASMIERERLAAIGEFASGIAHEIRTPLATIGLALDYSKKLDLPENVTKRLNLASNESQRVARLLEDMLLYAKPMQLQKSSFDIVSLLNEVINTHCNLLGNKQLQCHVDADKNQITVHADRDRLTQLLLNLQKNAAEASPMGENVDWTISVHRETSLLNIQIRNSSTSISDEQKKRLFTPFFTTKSEGTGLGLAIVKRVVEAHNGNITIDNTVANRVCFSIQLPLKSAH